jgi:soluble lytic murein transglycosylase
MTTNAFKFILMGWATLASALHKPKSSYATAKPSLVLIEQTTRSRVSLVNQSLNWNHNDLALLPLALREQANAALVREDYAQVIDLLEPVIQQDLRWFRHMIRPYAQALSHVRPQSLIENAPIWSQRIPSNPEYQRLQAELFYWTTQAYHRIGNTQEMRARQRWQYLYQPEMPWTLTQEPVPPLQPEEWLIRAESSLKAKNLGLTQTALAHIPGFHVPAETDKFCRLAYLRSKVQRMLRQPEQALHILKTARGPCAQDSISDKIDYLYSILSTIRQEPTRVEYAEYFAQKYPNHALADDVYFALADDYAHQGDLSQATAYYLKIIQAKHTDDYCGEALFRLGYLALQAQGYAEAADYFAQMAQAQGSPCKLQTKDRARGYYWWAYSLEQQHQAIPAGFWRDFFQIDPYGFYAQALRYKKQKEKTTRDHEFWQWASAPAPQRLPDCPLSPTLQTWLGPTLSWIAYGLFQEARMFLTAQPMPLTAASSRLDQCDTTNDSLKALAYLETAGGYMLAFQYFNQQGFQRTASAYPDVWRLLYPLAYRKLAAKAEQEHHVPPWLLQAIVREESRFNPEAMSSAQAYGLSQLIFPVAQALYAKRYKPQQLQTHQPLFDPSLSLELGAMLLGQNLQRANNDPTIAIAAYNAGLTPARKWLKNKSTEDIVDFVDTIPFFETRHYVRNVLESWGMYVWLAQAPNTQAARRGPVLPLNPFVPTAGHGLQ